MPTQTFYHLPKNKRDTLIQAAKKEFSRVPLHEASIANIIKEAGIPRGSFYQYFESKEDLYYYLLNQVSEKNNAWFIALLKENNGDIFETFKGSFQMMIENNREQEHKSFFKNVFLNMNYKMENILASQIYQNNQKSQYLNVISLINTEQLNIRDEQELDHTLKIILSVTFHNLIQVFVKDLTNKEALQNYATQMELLQRGLYKFNPTN